MKKIIFSFLAISALSLVSFQIDTIIDFLSTGSILKFENESYQLAWSSHPNDTYYKQEYLRESDNKFENYQKMLIVEAIKSDISLEQASTMKINELNTMKKTNPLVQYKIEKAVNEGEIVISFMLSGGKNILEWNMYRYQQQKIDKDAYLVLYAYSYRNYFSTKEDIVTFLDYVKTNNANITALINTVAVPKIQVK